jgi:pimeloyl-ACP methyl ester carboxylesterase
MFFTNKSLSKMINTVALILLTFLLNNSADAQEKITFKSRDGLTVTADWYYIDNKSPVIILCHQARYSRGEYLVTAKRLNKLGFNCIAIDQRSGKEVNGIVNETAALAAKKGLGTNYLDAEQDILAAIDYAKKIFNRQVILLGSSYSASLVLKIAKENENVSAAIAFSPGEYFEGNLNLQNSIEGLNKPLFVASSKSEAAGVREVLQKVESDNLTHFVPSSEGVHGSRMLWKETEGNQQCWLALMGFLEGLK